MTPTPNLGFTGVLSSKELSIAVNPYEPFDHAKKHSEPTPLIVEHDPLPYTIVGKLVLVAAIATPIVGVCGTLCILPPRQYQWAMLCIPFVLPAAFVFFGGCAICRRLGFRIRKDDVVNEDGRIEIAKPIYESIAKPSKSGYCRDCASEVEIDDDYRCPKCGWPI